MTALLAIDPGNSTGWAVYVDRELWECGATSLDKADCRALAWIASGRLTEFWGEVPQVYRDGKAKGDPNDLIKVALGLGRWVERVTLAGVRTIEIVKPRDWKGTIPKDVHHRRILPKLSDAERARIPSIKGGREDMLDAVALGLFGTGRVRRAGA